MQCPNEQLWTGSREKSLVHRDLLYTLCVAHGIMLSRQVFTPRTFTLKPRITCEDLLRSTEYASKYFESTVEKINLSLKDICQVICEVCMTWGLACDTEASVPCIFRIGGSVI